SWQLQQRLAELAKKNRIDLSKPFEDLSKKARETLMDGAGGLPGILAILDETYQASSEAYREWLTEYMSPAECPACHGQRLRPASLSVRVKNFAIGEFTGLAISRALMTVRNWELSGRENQIAGSIPSATCATWAIPCWSWSTTLKPSSARTTSSISVRARDAWAGSWSPPALPPKSSATRRRSLASISPAGAAFPSPRRAARATASGWPSAGRASTI